MLAQLQLPTRDLGHGQLVAGGQFGQRLALGQRGQRHLGSELGRVATAGAFWGHNRAKLARLICPVFGEYSPKPSSCEVDMADYSGRLNDAFTRKARQINAFVARELPASLPVKLKVPIDNILINGANWTRKHVLKQLCDRCSVPALFKQDSLLFIEVYGRGYCYSYTLYVLDDKKQGFGYQRIYSQPACKYLTKAPDNKAV